MNDAYQQDVTRQANVIGDLEDALDKLQQGPDLLQRFDDHELTDADQGEDSKRSR